MPRFDLAKESTFQSRDGGVSKGGLVRNGFTERDGEGAWSWQRPALGSGEAAPFSGQGLGMFVWGTNLYAMYFPAGGTATSGNVLTGGAFTLTAGTHTGGNNEIGYISPAGIGTINPSTIRGHFVSNLYSNTMTGTNRATWFGYGTTPVSAGRFSSLVLGTTTLGTSSAAINTVGTTAFWAWIGSYVPPGVSTGRVIP